MTAKRRTGHRRLEAPTRHQCPQTPRPPLGQNASQQHSAHRSPDEDRPRRTAGHRVLLSSSRKPSCADTLGSPAPSHSHSPLTQVKPPQGRGQAVCPALDLVQDARVNGKPPGRALGAPEWLRKGPLTTCLTAGRLWPPAALDVHSRGRGPRTAQAGLHNAPPRAARTLTGPHGGTGEPDSRLRRPLLRCDTLPQRPGGHRPRS